MTANLPVAIIGAGPVGLAAAAQLVSRGERPLVLEAGATVGANVLAWGHVRLFSPWRYLVDNAAADLLTGAGRRVPNPDDLPTGRELVEDYLRPLAETPALRPHIRLGARVTAVTRRGLDKLKTAGREEAPFLLHLRAADGGEEAALARAVIDASGTYATPNPLGASGLPAVGEAALADRIAYGIPDALGVDRARYAGKRVLVVGSGHSAFNALLDLAALAEQEPATTITWAVRRRGVESVYGGGEADALPARGALGLRLRTLIEAGRIDLATGFRVARLARMVAGIVAVGEDGATLPPVDEIIAATGFRPDLAPLRELRLALDPAVESPATLAPLIDPNIHSCGSVPPHGEAELRQPEPGFYIAGMKSYGRAPTFLLLTGYEQVRSIVAALTGDWQAAREVRLELPQTGVCSAPTPALAAATPLARLDSALPALAAVGAESSGRPAACCG
jgi:thioredoxin reductase